MSGEQVWVECTRCGGAGAYWVEYDCWSEWAECPTCDGDEGHYEWREDGT